MGPYNANLVTNWVAKFQNCLYDNDHDYDHMQTILLLQSFTLVKEHMYLQMENTILLLNLIAMSKQNLIPHLFLVLKQTVLTLR